MLRWEKHDITRGNNITFLIPVFSFDVKLNGGRLNSFLCKLGNVLCYLKRN